LNILLADKSEGATDRQSRNGAGKTSFVELIHFLFGANADKDSIFRSDAVAPWAFEARVDVGGALADVARSGAKPSRIRLQGDTAAWPIQPTLDSKSGEMVFSNEQWRTLLGTVFFGLSTEAKDEHPLPPDLPVVVFLFRATSEQRWASVADTAIDEAAAMGPASGG
jgi:uncharacterized protein YydD (DUF2326 family)